MTGSNQIARRLVVAPVAASPVGSVPAAADPQAVGSEPLDRVYPVAFIRAI
jgi:hypothetical protein